MTTVTRSRTGGMALPEEAFPNPLPTDRLLGSGKAIGDIRDDLRHFSTYRNAGTLASIWLMIGLAFAAATLVDRVVGYVALFVVMGPLIGRLAILGHEAAHRLLFHDRRANDVAGRWLLDYPVFVPFDVYRRVHFAHHKEEFGPNEPDMPLYTGYPLPASSWRRKLTRDALGISGWKNLQPLLRSLRSSKTRPLGLRILGTQVVLFGVIWAATGHWWLYLVGWLAPWMTTWRVMNRLRAIAEHAGLEQSKDRRRTTHHMHQSWLARAVIVPYHTGWHLAHHVDMGVPWRNLPAFHSELVRSGWVTEAYEYPSYRAFWKACSSAPEPDGAAA
jgi:fatty acid desaturase